MRTLKVIVYRDSLGNRSGWTVVALPSDYRDGDALPVSHLSDRFFETEAEADTELQRLTAEAASASK